MLQQVHPYVSKCLMKFLSKKKVNFGENFSYRSAALCRVERTSFGTTRNILGGQKDFAQMPDPHKTSRILYAVRPALLVVSL